MKEKNVLSIECGNFFPDTSSKQHKRLKNPRGKIPAQIVDSDSHVRGCNTNICPIYLSDTSLSYSILISHSNTPCLQTINATTRLKTKPFSISKTPSLSCDVMIVSNNNRTKAALFYIKTCFEILFLCFFSYTCR